MACCEPSSGAGVVLSITGRVQILATKMATASRSPTTQQLYQGPGSPIRVRAPTPTKIFLAILIFDCDNVD